MPADLGKVFLGTHRHRLDSKQRVTLPADYRRIVSALEEGSEHEAFGIALAADRSHLIILPLQSLFSQAAKGGHLTDAHKVAPFCAPFSFDAQGRTILSAEHISQLGLTDKENRELVIVGVYDRIEIWPKKTWDERESQRRLSEAAPILGDPSKDEPGPG
ncbi:MAG: hypothetical protein H6858_09200 [Rhodospirillales bacterium]|nr:hypothetical protein [Alphaproteobacteria bacterium]MCB9977760.1 hypothetical protein [Rhodospirillales bacterium]